MIERNGFVILPLLLFMAIVTSSLYFLSQSLRLYQESVDLYYDQNRAFYLAYSGLWMGRLKNPPLDISPISVPSPDLIKWLAATETHCTGCTEASIHLRRIDAATIVSLGVSRQRARVLMTAKISTKNSRVSLSDIQYHHP